MSEKVKPGSPAAVVIAEEEALHARVQARAAADLVSEGGGRSMTEELDQQLISLRDAIAEAKPEDLAPLVEQMTRLAALRGQVGEGRDLPIDTASPYFAHMSLREGQRTRDVLIGKRGYIDRAANIQIVDWRNAPVSQIYYRYEEGDDFEEEIAGRTLGGVVEKRRNVSISKSTLRRVGSPQGTFVRARDGEWRAASGNLNPTLFGGQGSAARAPRPAPKRVEAAARVGSQLGFDFDDAPRADKLLPEIAALIDGEQFDLITKPTSGIVAIQGGAGSGKTTVALHRVAYLAFGDAGFKAKKMLFVVPSLALVRYVADVLPSLGVRGVAVLTYANWAKTTRQRLMPGSGGKYNDDTPDAVSRVKKHPLIEDAIAQFVAAQERECADELEALADRNEDEEAVLARHESSRGEPLVPRLRKLAFWAERARLRPETSAALESFTKRWIARADDLAADWAELLTDEARLTSALAGVPGLDIRRAVEWTSRQIEEPSEDPVEGADGMVEEEGPAGRFDREDDPILLRLAQWKRGGLFDRSGNETRYQHVAIDEAQDRSAIEIRVLMEATEGKKLGDRSITLAGDMAQRVVFDNGMESWSELLERVGLSGTEVSPLSISYRSTAEVMALARQILGPELDSTDPLIARSGRPVEIHELGDTGEAVAFLAESLRSLMGREPTASVALLARYAEQADVYYAGLARAEVPRLRRVKRDEFVFEPGIDVTEISQVKGLEFDYVVLLDVNAGSYADTREARHLLHIGATRAAHQLWLVTTDKPSPLLPEDLTIQ